MMAEELNKRAGHCNSHGEGMKTNMETFVRDEDGSEARKKLL